MRETYPRASRFAAIVCAPLVILAALAACGVALGPIRSKPALGLPGPWSTAADIRMYVATVQVPSDTPNVSLSVSCPLGAQLIGGGFSASDVFEYDAQIIASYPSSANTWTAVAGTSSAFSLGAVVYCLPGIPSLDLTTVRDAPCPPATITLNTGFRGADSYTRCAARHVSSGSVAQTVYNPQSSRHSYEPGSVILTCPPGQTATGGEVSGGGYLLASLSAGKPFTSWTFTVGGDGDTPFSAHCVVFSAA